MQSAATNNMDAQANGVVMDHSKQYQKPQNKHQSTLLNNIDYTNAKLIEDSLKQTETLDPLEKQIGSKNPYLLQKNTAQINTQTPNNMISAPNQPSLNIPDSNLSTADHAESYYKYPQEPEMLSSSAGSQIKKLLPSLDKYNLKYPSFLFQVVNLKKLVLLVILCVIFQLTPVRNLFINNMSKITANEFVFAIILGLINAAVYFSVITCVNLD